MPETPKLKTYYRTIIDVELPPGHVPGAKVIVAVDPIIEAASAALTEAKLTFRMETDTVTPTGPRKGKSDPAASPSQAAPVTVIADGAGTIVAEAPSPADLKAAHPHMTASEARAAVSEGKHKPAVAA